MPRSVDSRWGRLADACLTALIIIAPAAGGGSNLLVLPILTGLASTALLATAIAQKNAGRSFQLHLFAAVLFALAILTLLQAVPLPHGLLAILSPTAADVRAFTDGAGAWASISYEPGATMREAGKLVTYAMIALVAHERARAHHNAIPIIMAVVVAGLSTAGIALIHRALELDKMLGILPTRGVPSEMLTTFPNENHAAGFLALCALSAVGLSFSGRIRSWRAGYIAAAVTCTAVSIVQMSRGGLIALGFGFTLLTVLLARQRLRSRPRAGTAVTNRALILGAAAVLLIPLAGFAWKFERVRQAFEGTGAQDLGPWGKAAGFIDALPLIKDHLWTGIGRGAYVSLYPHYKQSAVQLTYAYPENIFVELVSDWGALLGFAAFMALLGCIAVRLKRARSVAGLGALAGVAAVALQNFVDFSLEMPGVAVAVTAILAGVSAEAVRVARVESPRSILGAAAVPVLAAAAAVVLAFRLGDVDYDGARMEAIVENTPATFEALRTLALRHPANALFATRAAYAAERMSPPDIKQAFHFINRALFLAPTYASAHLASGRLLVLTGHREQGFKALQSAWRLASGTRRPEFIEHIVSLARSADEVYAAVPRRDAELDVPSEIDLADAVQAALTRKKPDWAKSLLSHATNIQGATPEGLFALALAAHSAADNDLADRIAQAALRLDPRHGQALMLRIALLREKGEHGQARAAIERALISAGDSGAVPLLRELLQVATAEGNAVAARSALHQLTEHLAPSYDTQIELARDEAAVALLEGDRGHAIRALDRGILIAPHDVGLRLRRADLLRTSGRFVEARADLNDVLDHHPGHAEAQAALRALEHAGL